jgi:hypothetical protein
MLFRVLEWQRVLSFPYPMSKLGACESRRGRAKRREPEHRGTSPLDGSVILLDDVIQVAARTNFHTAPANIFLGKQLQRSQRCLISIDIDFLSYSGTYWSTQRIMVV